ncbi:MAG: DNA polymerase III subunit delta', partial [Prochlorothrix sp.]
WVEASYQVQGRIIPLSQADAEGMKRKTPPQIRLAQVREVSQFLSRAPLEAVRHVVVLEQAETMGEGAANGLLKTLEEPGLATLILLAPSVDRLLPTLVSRCQRIPFQRLAEADLAEILRRSNQAHLLENPRLLAQAEGSPGAAIELGDSLQSLDPDLLVQAQDLPRSPRQALALARRISQELDLDQQLWLLSYLQQCCWQAPYDQGPDRIGSLEEAKGLLRRSVQPRLVWEVMLLRLAGATVMPAGRSNSVF